jgi:hypothetical protein
MPHEGQPFLGGVRQPAADLLGATQVHPRQVLKDVPSKERHLGLLIAGEGEGEGGQPRDRVLPPPGARAAGTARTGRGVGGERRRGRELTIE